MKFRPPLFLILLLVPGWGIAAPLANTRPKPAKKGVAAKISIDAGAKTVLERAAKLYGATPRWSAQITHKGPFDSSIARVTIAFARPHHLKVQYQSGAMTTLEIVDGKTFSAFVKDPDIGTRSKQVEQTRSLPEHLVDAGVAGVGDMLALLIRGKTGLDAAELKEVTQGATSFAVKRLPDASWKGLSCQRILLEKRFKPADAEDFEPTVIRDEHWFTVEGKLVRTIAMESGDTWKSEITAQNFAPVFTNKTFVFVAPPTKSGKILP